MRKPDFFMVGAPKCGTTSVRHYLKQHPDIFMAEAREIHHFGSDLDYWWWEKLTEDEYLQQFAGATDEARIGERSNSYLVSRRAPEEIKAFSPDARIIVNLRSPIEMLHALHSQLIYNGVEFIENFEQALTNDEDRVPDWQDPRPGAEFFNGRDYREITKYASQLQKYFEIFGRDRVHVIIFDDLKNDTAGTYRNVLRFLKVDEDFQPELRIENRSKRLRSLKMMHPPLFVRRIARSLVPKPVRKIVKHKLDRINSVHAPRKPINPEHRRQLQAELAPEVAELSRLIDRDLSHWSE